MLALIGETKRKKAVQRELERSLKRALGHQGTRNIGYPGGNVDLPIYSSGEGKLWVAFRLAGDYAVPRYVNLFGVFHPNLPGQSITVEINVQIEGNGRQAAGFFAEDSETGDIFLMHSGKLGGRKSGIGKSEFLSWLKAKPIEVADEKGGSRMGIAVGRLGDADLIGRIWTFVQRVRSFKDQADAGALEALKFKKQVVEFDRYSKEFSGSKQGARGGPFEYVTYHGDVVHKLWNERSALFSPGEEVFNSPLVDLFVKRDGELCEVYEVKTGVGRQMLYTAIGQVLTHAAKRTGEVTKYLVLPAKEAIPEDLEKAIGMLGIKIRRFRLRGPPRVGAWS